MKVYTRTGDEGQTSVIGGRVSKDDHQVEAYGTIDELNSYVGQAVSLMVDEVFADLRENMLEIQHELFDCGADLAFVKISESKYKVGAEMVERLEHWIDAYEERNPEIERFILPGGTLLSSTLHVCRTVCRRAERRVVTLAQVKDINPEVRRYLNRLSDYFFVIARTANVRSQAPEIEYIRSAKVFRNKK
ncbi:cob(I)yrinic acid a,c-diamide adenosyltransferase [Paenibacillus sp.]|jgi:cob(I)alamin adenosyltransferase|uniref:cob(I)yrinic acid a,c-diamide adenosyltransferase n=1 Tax=Paenibacillus sp. TaxID=58172 RepID=UPI00282AD93A|nr:cob(I)yrinic acid a,c-diamide adenosyltransferase [Paenibacillus sp.]MDR0268789.1 cob(I)yrinic acid a,c-diamide adenosyltransferase [Paenibacillus sp.]